MKAEERLVMLGAFGGRDEECLHPSAQPPAASPAGVAFKSGSAQG